MSLQPFVLALFLILLGISWLGWVAISTTVLGVLALVAGILILVDGYHPVTVWRRGPTQ